MPLMIRRRFRSCATKSLPVAAMVFPLFFSIALGACTSHLHRPATPAPAPISTSYTVQPNLIYTPKQWPEALKADLYQPQSQAPKAPAVLLIHGGGWAAPDRREQMQAIAQRLAQRGYVVMNASYRFAPQYRYPAPVDDLRQALRWLRQHADTYRLNPEKIAAFGYSAGGHLAAQLGSLEAPAETQVQAVVAGGAPTDLRKYRGGRLVPGFLGGTQAEVPAQFIAASPITHVSANDPPTFLYHGGLDTLVPLHHAKDYQQALEKAKVENELLVLRGRGHISAFLTDDAAIDAALDFLDRHLRAATPPR